MEIELIIAIVLAIVIFFILIGYIATHNKMIKYRNKVEESLSMVDIHLKLRFDLIPNLVKVVKEYSKHEKEVFSSIVELRNNALKETDEKKKLEMANQMLPKIRELLIIAEDYPVLKADSLYKSLMEELVIAEDKIAASRRFYDSNVTLYNNLIQVFPNNIIAALGSFKKCELFKIDVGENFSQKINFD